MSSDPNPPEITMDASQLYREEMYTDQKIGAIRQLTPVTAAGDPDDSRKTLFVGSAQVLTPAGALPLSFEIMRLIWRTPSKSMVPPQRKPSRRPSRNSRKCGGKPPLRSLFLAAARVARAACLPWVVAVLDRCKCPDSLGRGACAAVRRGTRRGLVQVCPRLHLRVGLARAV